MHLSLANIVLVIVGLLLHVLVKMIKAKKKHNSKFSIIFYLKDNVLQLVTSAIMALVVFYFGDTITEGLLDVHVHKESHYYKVFALCAGYQNHVIFDEFIKTNGVKTEGQST